MTNPTRLLTIHYISDWIFSATTESDVVGFTPYELRIRVQIRARFLYLVTVWPIRNPN